MILLAIGAQYARPCGLPHYSGVHIRFVSSTRTLLWIHLTHFVTSMLARNRAIYSGEVPGFCQFLDAQ
jgi:hypothetical protein